MTQEMDFKVEMGLRAESNLPCLTYDIPFQDRRSSLEAATPRRYMNIFHNIRAHNQRNRIPHRKIVAVDTGY